MALRSKQDYIGSISALNTELYAYGKQVNDLWDHPCFRPAMEAIGMVYELSEHDGDKGFYTAHSPFIDGTVNRFLHIHQNQEDLRNRFRLSRFLVHKHGACIGARCVGTGALNSLFATTYDMDQGLGTDYHRRLISFIKYVQENDLAVSGAMMDVKGNRKMSPHQQADPDLYLHIVEKREDGIVVRGAKASISGAAIANEIVVLPCTALKAEEVSYAVSFAVPSDAPGVLHIAEAPAPNMRRLVGEEMDYGNAKYGVHGSTHVIFDDVFVPRERVFMCGEYTYAGSLVSHFANLQRLNTSSCKAGHRDLLIGAAAVAADDNGIGNARHISEKLTDLYFQSEMSFGCALASIYTGEKTRSGVFMPDPLYINIAKLQGVNAIWEGNYIVADIAGGLVCTSPTAADLKHEKIGVLLNKYLKGSDKTSTENRIRMLRLIEYLTGQGSVVPIESTHGAGSPQAQKIIIQQSLMKKIEKFKTDAKIMAGIEK
ncbi:MAG: 4-hydroxyphenylacetate 3-hydroxylase N-terminal domain-containing protein [Syntrophales bacterium]|nr:4-hydroxyphenylacetate 3-hydroxylase N-terminal domain-containing protein [Syntrophales bacterium]